MSKGWKRARLVDQPCFGRAVILEWWKRRWECPDAGCGVGSFTEQNPRIAPVRARLTTRAGRWATQQVGRGRTVVEVAEELGCSWHTVSKEVNRWGEALWKPTGIGWGQWRLWGWTKPCSSARPLAAADVDYRGGEHPRPSADRRFPRNKTQKEPSAGYLLSQPGGGRKYNGPSSTCPELTGPPTAGLYPRPFRSPTRSTSSE